MRGLSKRGRQDIANRLGRFVQQYARKAQKGVEPNDRSYDPGVYNVIRRLRPEELDMLLNGDPADDPMDKPIDH